MPRGVRKAKALTLEEKLTVCNSRIEKLTRELKEAKAERSRLLKDKDKYDQEDILRAIRESGKSKEEILKAIVSGD